MGETKSKFTVGRRYALPMTPEAAIAALREDGLVPSRAEIVGDVEFSSAATLDGLDVALATPRSERGIAWFDKITAELRAELVVRVRLPHVGPTPRKPCCFDFFHQNYLAIQLVDFARCPTCGAVLKDRHDRATKGGPALSDEELDRALVASLASLSPGRGPVGHSAANASALQHFVNEHEPRVAERLAALAERGAVSTDGDGFYWLSPEQRKARG